MMLDRYISRFSQLLRNTFHDQILAVGAENVHAALIRALTPTLEDFSTRKARYAGANRSARFGSAGPSSDRKCLVSSGLLDIGWHRRIA